MIYPNNFESKIGFDRIRELARNYCLFEPGRRIIDELGMLTDQAKLNLRLDQTEEFRKILTNGIDFPIDHFIDISRLLKQTIISCQFADAVEAYF